MRLSVIPLSMLTGLLIGCAGVNPPSDSCLVYESLEKVVDAHANALLLHNEETPPEVILTGVQLISGFDAFPC